MGNEPTQWKDVPEQWREDLNPEFEAGQNYGMRGEQAEMPMVPASDIKEVVDMLSGFTDGELNSVLVLPIGGRLEQGATYIDLADPERREFTAMGGMVAGPDHYYVAKEKTGYVLWNRLIGVTNPERLDEGSLH